MDQHPLAARAPPRSSPQGAPPRPARSASQGPMSRGAAADLQRFYAALAELEQQLVALRARAAPPSSAPAPATPADPPLLELDDALAIIDQELVQRAALHAFFHAERKPPDTCKRRGCDAPAAAGGYCTDCAEGQRLQRIRNQATSRAQRGIVRDPGYCTRCWEDDHRAWTCPLLSR